MWYVTLEGRFKALLGHHFTLLNHSRHGLFISFPFFLLSSLESSMYALLKNRRAPILHEGLIFLIMEHFQSLSLALTIKGKEDILSALFGSSDSDSSSDEEEWSEDEVDVSPMGEASTSKKKEGGGF